MKLNKNIKYIIFLLLPMLAVSCSRADEDQDVLSQEDISNIILNIKNDATGISQTYNYTLNSATNPVIQLTDGATYTVNAVFKNGNEDETESIKAAKDEHFLIFDFRGSQIDLTREDDESSTRSDRKKVGLITKWNVIKAQTSASPTLTVSLIHDATEVNESPNGTAFGSVVGGETDAMALFGISN